MINMKKYLFFLGMALVALIFSSCNGKKGVFTPTSSGRAYEILLGLCILLRKITILL